MIPMDFVKQLFEQRWPRLYLDTAELVDIGRGRLSPTLVDELLATIAKHSVVLVVSHAHMCDALKPGNRDAPGFLASTLDDELLLQPGLGYLQLDRRGVTTAREANEVRSGRKVGAVFGGDLISGSFETRTRAGERPGVRHHRHVDGEAWLEPHVDRMATDEGVGQAGAFEHRRQQRHRIVVGIHGRYSPRRRARSKKGDGSSCPRAVVEKKRRISATLRARRSAGESARWADSAAPWLSAL